MNSNNKTARDAPYFQTSGALIKAASDWASIVENFPYGLGALIFFYLLYQSELIPQWLSVWGLVGAILMLAMGLLRMYGHPVVYLAIPIILNELVLAVWLIVMGFNSSEIAYVIVGVLFMTATVAYSFGVFLLDPIIGGLDYLTSASVNSDKVIIGAFLVLIDSVAVAGIGIVMYPILKKHNETLALSYTGARIVEGVLFMVNVIAIRTLLTLSQEFVKAGVPDVSLYQTLGNILQTAGDWAFLLGFGVAFTLSALILNFLLYRSKLVPRWLSLWGFVGAALLWVYYLLQSLGVNQVDFLFFPIAVQEMVFAVWLIVKGFSPSAIVHPSA